MVLLHVDDLHVTQHCRTDAALNATSPERQATMLPQVFWRTMQLRGCHHAHMHQACKVTQDGGFLNLHVNLGVRMPIHMYL